MKNEESFTVKRLDKYTNNTTKDIEYKDNDQKGLLLRVSTNGTKTFRFKAWDRRRQKTVQIILGRYPDISITEARAKAAAALNDINQGVDIQAARRLPSKEDTFDALFLRWLNSYAKAEKKTWPEDKSRYELYIKGHLGDKPYREISSEDILKWRAKLTKQPKQEGRGKGTISTTTINRAYAIVSTVYNRCAPTIPNPCKGVKKYSEEARDRFLHPDEVERLFEALDHEETPEYVADYVKLFLATGARRSNVLGMKWADIDFAFNRWVIGASESKNKSVMVVPLLEPALEILSRRKQTLTSEYVFPSMGTGDNPGKTGHLVEPKKGWKSLLKRAGLEESIRLHDLRRTMGSYQAISGSSLKIVGDTLGHKSIQATEVYARLSDEAKRKSMGNGYKEMTKKLKTFKNK